MTERVATDSISDMLHAVSDAFAAGDDLKALFYLEGLARIARQQYEGRERYRRLTRAGACPLCCTVITGTALMADERR